MNPEQTYLLINKYLAGELTTEEKQTLDTWLQASPENQQRFDELSRTWKLSGKAKLDLKLDTEQAWQNIYNRTQFDQKHKIGSALIIYRVAASLLVLVAAGTVIFTLLRSDRTDHIYLTASNQREHVVLPDGSEVWLNQNSELSYSDDFTQSRQLELTGEAYFEVAHDAARPFTIETAEMLTTVVGTSFSIVANEQQQKEEVIVTSGKVKISTHSQRQPPVFLEAGTKVTYDRESDQLVKSPNQDLNFLAWKDGNLKFVNTSLVQIGRELERYFEVEIALEHQDLGNCQFTGEFSDPTLEEVLDVLTLSLEITYVNRDGEYLLQGAGCKEDNN